MKICGVELKGGEAIICLLTYDRGAFTVSECRQRVFAISSSEPTQVIRDFQFAFKKLMEDYAVDEVVIMERHQKGKFAGSATSFKLEAVIQLLDMPVTIMDSDTSKALLKRNPILVDIDELGLKRFQHPAFKVAYAYHNFLLYGQSTAE